MGLSWPGPGDDRRRAAPVERRAEDLVLVGGTVGVVLAVGVIDVVARLASAHPVMLLAFAACCATTTALVIAWRSI